MKDKNRKHFESNDNNPPKLDDKTVSCAIGCRGEEQEEDIPKWAPFICPSCGIFYGISALVKALRKRQRLISHET